MHSHTICYYLFKKNDAKGFSLYMPKKYNSVTKRPQCYAAGSVVARVITKAEFTDRTAGTKHINAFDTYPLTLVRIDPTDCQRTRSPICIIQSHQFSRAQSRPDRHQETKLLGYCSTLTRLLYLTQKITSKEEYHMDLLDECWT